MSFSRSYAPRCCRAAALRQQTISLQQQPQLHIRSISSSIPRLDAEATRPATEHKTPQNGEIPFSHLQPELNASSTTKNKNPSRLPQDQNQPPPSKLFIGTVTRTGTMPQTVQITRRRLVHDPFIQKDYTRPLRLKAHDPHPPSYLREGDVVEYGTYTPAERQARAARDADRVAREEQRLAAADASGKLLRRFQRNEATKKLLRGEKMRGVQFVVRRVVTPFGVGLDERMEMLNGEAQGGREDGADGGHDSLLRSLGASTSRSSTKPAVAG